MIKNLIFDFGNIFIDLDTLAGQTELARVGLNDFTPEMATQNLNYEMGLHSTAEQIAFYLNQFPKADQPAFEKAWSAVLGEIPEKRVVFLEELAKSHRYRLFLLSNTNDLHIRFVEENEPLFARFKACFEKIYLSHEINLRKPDDAIYDYVLADAQIKAEESLFIDDLQENTDAAKNLGFKVWRLIPGKEDVTELFQIKKELFTV